MEAFFKQLESAAMDTTLDHQAEYPDLYADCDFDFAEKEAGQKICYLTFDDGPNSEVTPQVLDTLKEYGIKATFFVIYRDGEAEKALYKRIVEEMTRRGYVYYDWNSSSGDASGAGVSVSDIVSDSLSTGQYDKKILLCHDGPGHQNTAKALPDINEGLME